MSAAEIAPQPVQPQYFRVKDWEQYQHYGERRPDWIKLHAKLLDSYKFACLSDAAKLHVVLIWLLASRCNNSIPYDAKFVQRRIGTDTEPNLHDLVARGYLELIDNKINNLHDGASNALSKGLHDAALEREEEKSKKRLKHGKSESKFALFENQAGPENSWGIIQASNGDFDLSRAAVVDFAARYPKADIEKSLRDLQRYLAGNESKRRAKSAMAGYISAWIRRDALADAAKLGKIAAKKQTKIDTFAGAK